MLNRKTQSLTECKGADAAHSSASRRRFLLGACSSLLTQALPTKASAQTLQPTYYATTLWLKRGKEQARFNFLTDEGYRLANYLLRDVQAGVTGRANPYLLYQLAWMQAVLDSYGHRKPLEIHSGLRTPATNDRTEGASLNSRHLQDSRGYFNAADASMDGIPSAYLGKLAATARYGGVGFYPNSKNNRIHVDIGRIRYWSK